MNGQPNTLDQVRRIKDFDQRLEYVLGLDDSEFDDLDVFRAEEHEPLPYSPETLDFRFRNYETEYAAVVVGTAIPHFETHSGDFIAGYEGNVFQLCKGVSKGRPDQKYTISVIVAQSVGEPLEVSDLLQLQKLDKEVAYMKKIFKKMGLPQYADDVTVHLGFCYF